MGSKGSNTTTTTSTPNPQAMAAYSGALKDANQAYKWGMQYNPVNYNGELVAGVNPQQYQGISGINQYANAAQPAIGTAKDWITQAAQPITGQQIQQYMSPYTQDVVNATEAEFNRQNQIGLQSVKGNAISKGAFGGNREAIAEDQYLANVKPRQQQLIANLYNQGYNTAQNMALTEQQNLAHQAYGLANVAGSGQNLGLTGANAQIGAGGLEQGTQQALDSALWNKYMMTGAYPMQLAAAQAGIDIPAASSWGGTSTTTGPPPSMISQIAGLGTAGLGLFGSTGAIPYMMSDERVKDNLHQVGVLYDGQPVYRFNYKGNPTTQIGLVAQDVENTHPESVREHNGIKAVDYDTATRDAIRYRGGGVRGYDAGGFVSDPYIPTVNIAHGSGPPKPPPAPSQPAQSPLQGLGTLGTAPEVGAALADAAPFMALALNRGGNVRDYDDGGGIAPTPDPTGMLPYSKPQGIYPLQYPSFKGHIPNVNISHGSGIPKPPSIQGQSQNDLNNQAKQIGSLTKAIMGDRSLSQQDAIQDAEQDATEDARRGGGIRGYAFGGGPSGSLGGWYGADDDFNDSPESGVLYPLQDRGGITPNKLPRDIAALEEPTSKFGIGNQPPARGYSGSLGLPSDSSWPDDLPSSGALEPKNRPEQYKLGNMDPYDPKNSMYGFNPDRGGFLGSQMQKAYGTPDDDFIQKPRSKDPLRDFEDNGVHLASLKRNDLSSFVDENSPISAALRRNGIAGDGRGYDRGYDGHILSSYAPPDKTKRLSGLFSGIDLSADSPLWKSLIMAGGSMMASRSPFAGVGIGEGGQKGVQTYNQLSEQEKRHNLTQKEIDQKSEALAQRAEQLARREKLESQKLFLESQKPVRVHRTSEGEEIMGIRNPLGGYLDPITGKPLDLRSYGVNENIQPPTPAYALPVDYQERVKALPAELKGPEPIRNEEYLDTIPKEADTVKGLVNYQLNPASLSTKGGHRERLLNMAMRYDPTYDQTLYPAKQRGITEFYAGGPQSPAGIMTNGNTALLHLRDMSDALEEFKGEAGKSWNPAAVVGGWGVPFLSHWANQAYNSSLAGTGDSAAVALTKFNQAKQRFTEEVTKFYAGGQGTQAEREHALAILDSAKSLPELRGAIAEDSRLMKDKVSQMQNRLMQNMGPLAWRNALIRDPEGVLIYKNSRDALKTIESREKGENIPVKSTHSPEETSQILNQARAAISSGKSRQGVIDKLKSMGIDPSGL